MGFGGAGRAWGTERTGLAALGGKGGPGVSRACAAEWGRLGVDLGGAWRGEASQGAGRAESADSNTGGQLSFPVPPQRPESHGAHRWPARLLDRGAVAGVVAAVQLGVPRERRATGPAGEYR